VAEVETTAKAFYKGNLDFSYQFQNESSITSSSSLSMTDKLELRGTPEENPKFPHLGNRFIPKNIGYALVVSATADVFVTRLARSRKMIGYQVLPVDGIPPDVNTITFLMNPAYTMNGSLDGMTGSSATSDRFFKHVPEMRSQYGSLYPASYYRLQEAYDLKRQIEAEDKRRESYFSNFNVRTIDEASLNRNIDSGDAPSTIGVQREEDKPSTEMTAEEQSASRSQQVEQFQTESKAESEKTSAAAKAKQAEIKSKISDQEKQVHATESFAGWQKRMEDIQIRAGKRNIVNTYVWDADGGLRTEAQSFANTVEHTIGGSFSMSAGLGGGFEYEGGLVVELTAQATVNMTQTMSKTETRSKGFELNIDLSGMENKGVTDYKDNPILPGEKVDRYRFMSFYLESSTQHFQDFFNYVVDPEWLASNDEEARALRQAQAGKPNKTWRVLHRVTYVERPALMGFGRDVRQLNVRDENVGIGKVLVQVSDLQQKVNQILELINSQKP
ncbi:MAG: LamG domain-containing protein, partial [Microcoleus sp.]